jgi:membrane-bound lytic murein transglycosylase F
MKRILFSLLAGLFLSSCGNELQAPGNRVAPLAESHELVVLIPNGPTTFYTDAQGRYAGFEHDLLTRFAAQHNLKVRFIVSNHAELQARLRRGEAHLIAGLARESVSDDDFLFGPDYQPAEPVLVYLPSRQKDKIESLLSEGRALVSAVPQFMWGLENLKKKYPKLNTEVLASGDGDHLAERVARGEVDFALVGRHTAEIVQNAYPALAILDGVLPSGNLAWVMAPDDAALAEKARLFFAMVAKDGTLDRLTDRYYGHLSRLMEPDILAFLGKTRGVLPQYRDWFKEAEGKTGLDWRLIAALAYQESHWDPDAVSGFGVRGIMMLTQDTAAHLGVDRLDPHQSIQGGAHYITQLKKRLPERIAEPDRTWMALAAYNVGLAHLEDARVLAVRQKKNPDSWSDLKSTLPLLAKPEYFETVKFGYARGGEPVIFVENLRSYYDILVRRESPLRKRQPKVHSVISGVELTPGLEPSNWLQASAY